MLIKDVMTRPVITVEPSNSAYDAFHLMKEKRIRRLPVVKGGRLVGIVTDRDIRDANISKLADLPPRAWDENLRGIQIGRIMTKHVFTVEPDDAIECAAILMRRHKIGGIPVVQNGNVVGIVTESDIFRIFSTILGAEPGYLQVSLEDTAVSRAGLSKIVDQFKDEIQLVLFSPESPEIVLVFKLPGGKEDSQHVLKEMRGFKILDWDLFESQPDPVQV